MSIEAVLYLLAVLLLVLAAVLPTVGRVNLAVLGFAAFVLAYAWPVLAGH